MLKIAHTADVHIRSLSRHDEYREVLKAFAVDCLVNKVEHVFIGGDVFHTKTTGISPEYIEFLTWWLSSMSSVAHVHIVLGNHDGNLVNLSRQDAVSPIVDAIADPRIHLYKKSGVYPFAPGFNFCVYSAFDEPGWKDVRPVKGDVNIATYHGPVAGSVTETGWDIAEGMSIDSFKDYDFCFLGDIHKPQALGLRDGKPWIAYPGTPIQQNYAEQLEHGYLLWKIASRDEWEVETRPLPNPRPFVTLDWDGSTEDTLAVAQKFPRGSRFRIRSASSVPASDFHRLSESLKTTLSASEVTYKSDQTVDRQALVAGTTTVDKADIRSPDVIVRLLKDFHSEVELTSSDVEVMTEKVKGYVSTVSTSDDVSRHSKWRMRRLKWDNLFSYGEGNELDFDKLNGVVGIFGPNRTGKSSIVGTLMYSLFNTTDRGPVKNINVCNVRKSHCSSQAVFEHDGTAYVVERQTTKSTNKKGVTSAATALNFLRMNDEGGVDDMCGEQRTDTDKAIRNMIGTSEDFLLTSLSAQGDTCNFISQGSARRRAIISRFLDLDVFDRIHDVASREVTSLRSQLKNYPDRDWDSLRSKKVELMTELGDKIQALTQASQGERLEIELLKGELAKHNASPVMQADVDSQRRRVDDMKRKVNECVASTASLQSAVEESRSRQDTLRDLILKIDVESLKKKVEARAKLESTVVGLGHVHDREVKALAQQKKSLKTLEEVPCGDDYPTCKFIMDTHAVKGTAEAQRQKVEDARRHLEDARAALEALKDPGVDAEIERHDKAVLLLSKLELDVARKETEIEKNRNTCDACGSQLVEAEKKLVTLEEALNNEENEEIATLRSKIVDISGRLLKHDRDKLEAAESYGRTKAEVERLDAEKSARDSLLREVRSHELIAHGLSKKGVPLLVMKSQLPIVNVEVSKILRGIVDFTIEVEFDEDTDALEVYINYGDSRRIIELCSGMEKTIAAIALRVALLNVSSLPKPDFLIIDEGFGTLDNSGVEACNRFLSSLKSYFRTVFVITHVDGIKDAADFVVEITKSEKDSKVVCV